MLSAIRLERPLVVIDCETTGLDPEWDRVVEVCTVRLRPDGRGDWWVARVDPGRPIPAQVARLHGLGDESVRGCPPFAGIAAALADRLREGDWLGWNLPFDLDFLRAELRRCGLDLPTGHWPIALDPMARFKATVGSRLGMSRDLAGAVRHFLRRDHMRPHDALADCLETVQVLDALLREITPGPVTVAQAGGLLAGPWE